ncbi:MAG: hypothetical protein J5714_05055 [Alphaproteobacteria bacterium]|nr:hypothetical protein [Alphaproteobacteria bacterium]
MNVKLNLKGAGFPYLASRNKAKSINKVIDTEGRESNVEFADWLVVNGMGPVVLFYCFDKVPTVFAVCVEDRVLGKSEPIIGDNVFNAHATAVRNLRWLVENQKRITK